MPAYETAAVGVNVTIIVQFEPSVAARVVGAAVVPQVPPVREKPLVVVGTVALIPVTKAPVLLVSVSVTGALVAFTFTVPNVT